MQENDPEGITFGYEVIEWIRKMPRSRPVTLSRLLSVAAVMPFVALPGATAQELNRLELGIHDLAEMKTLSGVTLVFDPTKIIMVYALPRSSGHGGLIANVVGLAGGPQEVNEPAEGLLERLDLKPYFVALTLVDGAPVWVKASSVSFFRAVQPWDHTRAEAQTALNAGARPIFVKESVATIKDAINAIRRRNRDRLETQHQ
jgi:hypothetical protein